MSAHPARTPHAPRTHPAHPAHPTHSPLTPHAPVHIRAPTPPQHAAPPSCLNPSYRRVLGKERPGHGTVIFVVTIHRDTVVHIPARGAVLVLQKELK